MTTYAMVTNKMTLYDFSDLHIKRELDNRPGTGRKN